MTEIVMTDITTGNVAGDGIFDKLMVGVKAHIQQEYDNGRIKGSDYASVYLGALQSVLAQSVEVVLRDKQIGLQKSLQDVQIEGIVLENTIKQERHNYDMVVLLPDEHNKNVKVLEEVGVQIELKNQQVEGVIKDLEIKQYELDNLLPLQKGKGEEDIKLVYVTRVGKDKEVAGMGLDLVIKNNNDTPPNTYTPKYEVI